MTNYEKYFGTPELVADALDLIGDAGVCFYQELHNMASCERCDKADGFACDLENKDWLESEADNG